MKKKYFIILYLIVFGHYVESFAQSGEEKLKVVYKIGVKSDDDSKATKHQAMIEKLYEAYSQLEFELVSDGKLGVYQYDKKLEVGESDVMFRMAMNHGGGNSIYYRTKEKKVQHIQNLGKKINVLYDPKEFNWEITKETKNIKGFTCYKAVGYKEQYDPGRKKMLTFSPIAWFAPEINVPFGPKGIDGLPGLVLEGSMNGKLFFYADTIEMGKELNNHKKLKMENGEEMNEKKYLELLQRMRPITN
nr:GLPGLI family protein [uncultured Allomuricauda sp.]